jgi:tetratricopeptide (TPR) repeat protein
VVMASTGRKSEAIDAWTRAVKLDETSLDALFNLTVNLAAAGRRDEARDYAERYLKSAERYLKSAPPGILEHDIATIRRVLDGR